MAGQNFVEIARELVEAFNVGDQARFKRHLTPNVTYDEVATQRKIQGPDAFVQSWEQWRRAFPNVKGNITNTVASENTVLQEVTWAGTQDGPLELPTGTHPASGKQMTTRASFLCVFEGEKVRECRHYFDMLQMLKQIGAISDQAKGFAR
jgi:steroid delta-isomerase-like uncharacterized protein